MVVNGGVVVVAYCCGGIVGDLKKTHKDFLVKRQLEMLIYINLKPKTIQTQLPKKMLHHVFQAVGNFAEFNMKKI